jgi:hypothetical protein
LNEGANSVISIASDRVDPANETKLVHFNGPVKVAERIEDAEFGLAAEGALAISRQVEMYQWVEKSESRTEKNLGGSEETTTTYSYVREWRSKRVNSSSFKVSGHDNPNFAVQSNRHVVALANVGAFTVDGETLADLGTQKPIAISDSDLARIAGRIATADPVKLNGGEIYVGQSATQPRIGDLRVRFERTDLSQASLVGAQKAGALMPFKASNGREILLAAAGEKSADAMFKKAQTDNTVITWIIRVAGIFGLFIGFQLLLGLISIIGDIIPFIGSILGFGTSLLSLALALIVGPVIIGAGWIAYRPILAFSIIGGGIGVAVLLMFLRRRPPAAEQPQFGRA